MNLLSPISTLMTKDLLVLSPSSTMQEAKDVFSKKKIHHIPIVYAGDLVGILSKSDFLHFECPHLETEEDKQREEERMSTVKVETVMTKGIAKLTPDTRINVALELFKENIFHAIPVVDGGRLVGIVTTLDIIRQLDEDKSAETKY